MTNAFKQLIFLYAFIVFSAVVMVCSILFFPYIGERERIEYFNLSISILLLLFPLSFMISLFRLGNKNESK